MFKKLILAFSLGCFGFVGGHAGGLSISRAQAAPQKTPPPLFSQGVETFRLQNEKGKTPEFRILDDTPTEKALALAVIATLNAQGEVNPKIPVHDYIDLKVESLKMEPLSKEGDDVSVAVKLSGYELWLSKPISRKKLLSGETLELDFPRKEKEVSVFTVESSGKLRMKWDAKANAVLIENAQAKVDFDSQFGGQGTENIRFAGKGLRQLGSPSPLK